MKTGRQCRIMAAEAAGRAYITDDEGLKRRLTAQAAEWVRLGELADQQDGRVPVSPGAVSAFENS